jgi:hypothetical protein
MCKESIKKLERKKLPGRLKYGEIEIYCYEHVVFHKM